MIQFATIRVVGSALPADILIKTVTNETELKITSSSYELELGVTPREDANRRWSALIGAWRGYRDALRNLPEGDRAVGLTREKWLAILLRELGFGRVPATAAGGLIVDDRPFPISHCTHDRVPMHLMGWGVDIDRKTPGVAGAADRAPHAMLQEYLNRSSESLWGIVSNGRLLRLLRDSTTLVGQSFVEFDLEAMFDGEIFSDFVVLYLVCHATRFAPRPIDNADTLSPTKCILETWRTLAVESGTRALKGLQVGVAEAIGAIGTGLLAHPDNSDLRDRIDARTLLVDDFHQGLLRLVYRLLFCFVAEDRGLLLDPNASAQAHQRYADWYSTARLRRIATRRRGTAHSDLWKSLLMVLDGLGNEQGCPEIAIPGLGAIFENGPLDLARNYELANDALLGALRHLCVVQPPGGGPKRSVDYRNLGAEELGGVYESLLERVPRYNRETRTFTLEWVSGNDRKLTGAYYTPTPLSDCLLDSALDPLLDEAERAADPQRALLAITVCDPACGSGHFLVAAARRIAARLAAARARATGNEPTLIEQQTAMHDVVDHCIYGVDLNPMAAELAKVSLWLESLQPGRALSFIDGHIKVGNALLGTTPALLAQGIPDAAKRQIGIIRKTCPIQSPRPIGGGFSR